jgi:DNA-binding transcriptional regulator PaaX
MKLHQKGFLLVALSQQLDLWDYQLIEQVFTEYGQAGSYQEKTLRIALDELSAAGLIKCIEHKLNTVTEQLLFRYQLTDFGRLRMLNTGLL